MNIDGKAILLTGASTGIGLATAGLLADRGARLALVARSKEKLQELAPRLGAEALVADLSEGEAVRSVVDQALERFGHFDVLVNNAGQGYDVAVEHADPEKFLYIFRLHVLAPLLLMQALIPGMRARGGGAIVNVSSGTTLLTLPNNGPYSATKHALDCLSLTARKELERDNIRVSVVYPSLTETPFEDGTQAFSDATAMWNVGQAPSGVKAAPGSEAGFSGPPPPDPPGLVAAKIVEAIEGGEAEVFAHERMRRR